MNKKKMALVHSVIALLLCCSMLIGTTFAWFTDSVTSGKNRIIAGNLDVELAYMDANGDWQTVNANTNVFEENTLWEPGHTEVVYLRVSNAGTLALTYQLGVNIAAETGSINVAGEEFVLSDYIEFAAIEGVETAFASRDAARAAVQSAQILSTGYTQEGQLMAGDPADYVAFVVYMPETVGNEANYRTGEQAPKIELGINLYATQEVNEQDSFNKNYDANAKAEFFDGFQGGYAVAAVTADDQGVTTEEVAVSGGDVSAVIPAGVQVAEGATSLPVSVAKKEASDANIKLGESDEMRPLDVHIEGVAAGNTVPMLITLKHYLSTGINTGALRLYHVENGATVAMTQVAVPTNHNEFSYDPATGDVTLALASFSEVAVVADTNNPWDGKTRNYLWYNTSDKELTIYNADQLAGLAYIVDGKVDGIAQDSFAGKTVKLANNITLSGELFEPIGWGYEYNDWNVGDVAGKPFKGTFDGGQYDESGNLVGRNTIFNLYQSGWDLTNDVTGEAYTYTNCGFGLFAAASNATFKNLTISGADIRVECVEAGVLVGLSQNNCTYNNIKILDAKIANYQRPAGGLIGEVSGDGTTTITNVVIGNDVVVGSLWGDFDAPVGGVIGAYWNDVNKNPQIVMKDVEVGARLDVYNDITSAYQWHAYRRAGMLIGNTDMSDPNNAHKAYAPFLKCVEVDGKPTVKVYYGDWVDYTYCEFSNHNARYPWVRTQAGENCTAFSNPRWGVPNDMNGNRVTDMNHVHAEGDECNVLRKFGQLYGGGQGVYGQDKHDGVEVANAYSITYINDNKVLDIIYVTDNTKAVKVENDQAMKLVKEWAGENITGTWEFGGWMNAGSTKLTEIEAGNPKNIVLYPYFNKPYTARFVDPQGNVIAWCFFHAEDLTKLDATKAAAEVALPDPGEDLKFDYWQVQITDNAGKVTSTETYNKNSFAGYTKDVTIYPVYKYDGDVKLIPVDEDSDGIINYYHVGGYSNPNGQAMVEIPGEVLGIKVTQINEGAFSGYDGVHSIVVPNGVTIQKNAFTSGNKLGSGEEITIYFEGTKEQWNRLTKTTGWDYGIGTGSRIFFLKDGKVDTTQGYCEVVGEGGFIGIGTKYKWSDKTDFATVKNVYVGTCNCSISTTGDTAHTYKDANGNVMGHNDAGTPVNANGKEIYFQAGGWFGSDKLTDGSNTYYRYRPDAAYWEGV